MISALRRRNVLRTCSNIYKQSSTGPSNIPPNVTNSVVKSNVINKSTGAASNTAASDSSSKASTIIPITVSLMIATVASLSLEIELNEKSREILETNLPTVASALTPIREFYGYIGLIDMIKSRREGDNKHQSDRVVTIKESAPVQHIDPLPEQSEVAKEIAESSNQDTYSNDLSDVNQHSSVHTNTVDDSVTARENDILINDAAAETDSGVSTVDATVASQVETPVVEPESVEASSLSTTPTIHYNAAEDLKVVEIKSEAPLSQTAIAEEDKFYVELNTLKKDIEFQYMKVRYCSNKMINLY